MLFLINSVLVKLFRNITIFFSVLLLSGGRSLTLHDFHASVSQMQYNAAEKTFEISIRMFTDDLENALSKETSQRIQLSAKDTHGPLIERYIRKHFSFINTRRQAKSLQFVGKEQEGDATWVYVEIPFAEALNGCTLRQNVLMDMFDDQVNLVNISYLSGKKTLLFKRGQAVQEINW